MDTPRSRGIVVFGGGTATNSLVDVLETLRKSRNCSLQYIIPISDNGGSSSELIRVFGGPGIGDIRSRLVRLIPNLETDAERASIKALFNYRLSSEPQSARSEWLDIVEGRHSLWHAISSEKRELIRSIFNHMNMEIVKRARPSSVFNFSKASIGNLFLTGARLFTGSLESAIYLLSTICAIPPTVTTIPAINSNFTHHISAGLKDGSRITGQNAISHPSAPTSLPDCPGDGTIITAEATAFTASTITTTTSTSTITTTTTTETKPLFPGHNHSRKHTRHNHDEQQQQQQQHQQRLETEAHDRIEDATLPGSLPQLRKQYISYTKSPILTNDLPSPISRIWYINPYGHEIFPAANPQVLSALSRASVIIYSIGSLYTSLIPSIILRGVGDAISSPSSFSPKHKILILNSSQDRETGPSSTPLTATGFVRAIARAARESQGHFLPQQDIIEDNDNIDEDGDGDGDDSIIKKYVTHVLYLEGEGVPKVDKPELARLGVDCIRVYGRRVDGMLTYDEAGLARALEAVMGKSEMGRSRRNTSCH
ncbi:UPF0052-domain-containing protein [Xylaria sp. CBS 124048]|nr:UPF0052-domain-containing protein [Xylaria sp. CBS 124048]